MQSIDTAKRYSCYGRSQFYSANVIFHATVPQNVEITCLCFTVHVAVVQSKKLMQKNKAWSASAAVCNM